MIFQTLTTVTLAQAKAFEESQEQRGLLKEQIFSPEDCKWQLRTDEPVMGDGTTINAQWYQMWPYLKDAGTNTWGVKEMLMYSETIHLSKVEVKAIFDAVGLSIVPNQDDPIDKWMEIVAQGILYRIGVQREVFGLGVEDFEMIV